MLHTKGNKLSFQIGSRKDIGFFAKSNRPDDSCHLFLNENEHIISKMICHPVIDIKKVQVAIKQPREQSISRLYVQWTLVVVMHDILPLP